MNYAFNFFGLPPFFPLALAAAVLAALVRFPRMDMAWLMRSFWVMGVSKRGTSPPKGDGEAKDLDHRLSFAPDVFRKLHVVERNFNGLRMTAHIANGFFECLLGHSVILATGSIRCPIIGAALSRVIQKLPMLPAKISYRSGAAFPSPLNRKAGRMTGREFRVIFVVSNFLRCDFHLISFPAKAGWMGSFPSNE